MTQDLSEPKTKTNDLYETDFYAWTIEQAQILHSGVWDRLDAPNLREEIESLGKQQKQELKKRLKILLGHLLKWQFQQREKPSNSWRATISVQRREIAELIEENPSLKPYLLEAVEKAYLIGLELAVEETNLDPSVFPSECPYQLEQILNLKFFPE